MTTSSLIPSLNMKPATLYKISSSLSWGIFLYGVEKSNVFICLALFLLLILLIHSKGKELFCITDLFIQDFSSYHTLADIPTLLKKSIPTLLNSKSC